MPDRQPYEARSHRCVLAFTVLSLTALVGCRAFRCPKASDEAIAAARQLSLQGIDAQQHGRWEQAELAYASACEKCPRDERARFGYAEALWQRGDQEEAVAQMEEAVRLSGHDPERMVQLGNMYLALQRLDQAQAQADRAIGANRQLAGAWALLGKVQHARGSRSDALASFYRALSHQPHIPDVQLAVAQIYAEQNRPQRALTTLQALAEQYPPDQTPADVLIQESFALRQLGRASDAAQRLALAAQRTNPSADLLYELGRTQMQAGDTTAARLTVAAALERDPQHAAALGLSEQLSAQTGILAATLQR
jgi:tetratricopeptide (TPR) repeat protein